MKKFSISLSSAFCMAFLFFLASGLCAENAPKTDKGVLSVRGEARRYYEPDRAVVVLSVITESPSLSDAVTENSTKARDVVSLLKRYLKKEQGDSIRTSSYRVQPVYDYVNKRNVLRGYSVVNRVTVRTGEIKRLGDLIDRAIESGANQVQDIRFEISNPDRFCGELLKEAVEKAKREASIVAGALGVEIAGIKKVVPECGKEAPGPVYLQERFAMKAAKGPTPVESGDISIRALVSVDFYLAP